MTSLLTRPDSPGLDAFREEVRDWIFSNREGVGAPTDAANITHEQFLRNRAFLRKLGEQRWYAPGWPREYGGGGLSREHVNVVREELFALIPHPENVHPPGDISSGVAGSLWLLGDEDQKRHFLPQILGGNALCWELYTEPEAGSDLPGLRTTAIRHGDDYVINGTKTFVGGHFECDYFCVMAITDPAGARQKNLSVILVPWGTPGITVTDLNMIAGSRKRTIILDDVRVPVSARFGREGDGWTAFTASGGREFGPVGIGVVERDLWVLDHFVEYGRTAVQSGAPLSRDPHRRAALARAWIEGEWERLARERLEKDVTVGRSERAQVTHNRKLYDLRLGQAIHRTLGPLASINDPEWAPVEGEFEYFQRHAILHAHPGGTVEVQKIRIFRAMQAARPDLVGEAGRARE
jgi:alkylation response protein AidB-like acyl-CoA dehydrogenase